MNLAWDPSTSSTAGGYELNYGVTKGGTYTSKLDVGNVTKATVTVPDPSKTTTYYFVARAYDKTKSTYSAYSNEIAISIAGAAASDTVAPTAPSSLNATPASSSQIKLSWTASTDAVGVSNYLIERCQGGSCTNFAEIGTSSSASFSNTGLAANTSYRYRVRAADAAGNLSGYSSIATATTTATSDTSAPGTPTSVTASAGSASQINVSWQASTDNVGVAGYRIEQCQGSSCTNFAQIGTSTGVSFSNTGLTASTTYRYRVRANDAAGNLSGYSSIASATTNAGGIAASPSAGSCTSNCTIWLATATPKTVDDGDPSATEVGVKFKSDVGGKITGIRFYKGSANTGTHVGNLWSATGTKLASATFTNETGSGWQQVNFATPVTISADTDYVASYHTTVGHYSADQSGLAVAVDRPPLHALADGASGPNGLYGYGSAGTFPTMTWRSANYWVDVIFAPTTVTTPTTNLALNRPATSSSDEGSTLAASKAVDGNSATRWSSLFADPQWLSVDLGTIYNISRVTLSWEAAYATSYKVQVSNDGGTWTDIYSTTKGVGGTVDLTSISGVGRYVRVYGLSRGTIYGYSLWDVAVYGSSR